jgi:alkanesulfonate monooxygenase SsuD/methylene tetrahydromethanopterin reductase-like flavin-dependent oxidoreductase (luciferase family)
MHALVVVRAVTSFKGLCRIAGVHLHASTTVRREKAGSMTAQRGRPFKIGVQLPEVEWVAPWSDIKAMAQTAEAIGLDSVWFGEHLLYHYPGTEPRGPWECWSMMAAVAAVTERVEIGPLVACTNFHNPAHLAKMAATLDEISGGRLILGLGAGWYEHEYMAYGYPYDHRVSRFEEAFTDVATRGRNRLRRNLLFGPRLHTASPRTSSGRTSYHGRILRPAHAQHHVAARRFLERLVC